MGLTGLEHRDEPTLPDKSGTNATEKHGRPHSVQPLVMLGQGEYQSRLEVDKHGRLEWVRIPRTKRQDQKGDQNA